MASSSSITLASSFFCLCAIGIFAGMAPTIRTLSHERRFFLSTNHFRFNSSPREAMTGAIFVGFFTLHRGSNMAVDSASGNTRKPGFSRYPFSGLLFDSLPLGIIFQDAFARIKTANPAAERILGLSFAQMRGLKSVDPRWRAVRDDGSPFPGEEHPAMEALRTGEAVLDVGMGVFNPEQEAYTWLNVGAFPLRDESEALLGVYVMFEDVTERKRAQQKMRESEARFASLFSAMSEGIALHELLYDDGGNVVDYCIIDTNPAFEQQTGMRREAVIGRPATQAFGTAVAPFLETYVKVVATRQPTEFEEMFVPLGRLFRVKVFSPAPSRFVTVFEDITERRRAEEQLHLAANVFTHAREGIMITDAEGNIVAVNDAFENITGHRRDEVLGRSPRALGLGGDADLFSTTIWQGLQTDGYWYGEFWSRRRDGGAYALMLTVSAVRDAHGTIRQHVALFSDITPIKEHERQLEYIAHYDALTRLPNRMLLADRLQQAMAQSQRRGQSIALVYLDLDGFKEINDRHGHQAGDRVLVTVASRMKQALREGDTLARLGGDEFVAVLLDLADVPASVHMLNRLLTAAAQPMQFGQLNLQVSASLGVSFYPQGAEVDADQLLRQADQAMYQAKLAGRNRYHVFDAEQDRHMRGQHESLERIRRALKHNEFTLYFQPKVNMRNGTVIGVEALIRWQHPERGLLPPAAFLPLIEDHPLAVDLGKWVIEHALGQIERWHDTGLHMPVSVNIGARQLQQADFVDHLRGVLAAHPQVKAGDLEMEVLETSALEDMAQASQVIDACRKIGVMFSLDDFGTGYSSLTYLKRLPVTHLKIDQSFVCDMLDDPDYLSILDGVLGLANAFGRQVVAEGVETVEHGAILLQLGCDLAQGYGIARPMPAGDFAAWMAAWRPDPAWSDLPLVERAERPLLFASSEHRAWERSVENYLLAVGPVSQPEGRHCHFADWLENEAPDRYGDRPALAAVVHLHEQVHMLAERLCQSKAAGDEDAVQRGFLRLKTLQWRLQCQQRALGESHGCSLESGCCR
ncbi:EAL domain-containing protein [Rhodocyclus tenuis]|uniref:EAL domain-containing protein n=2 Tax=Rhodocyclus TaxID=1064 RepID=A0A6L5JVD8_RHOTE|nr:EAL domain-containing protein [Rhodocyclus gracilis]